MLVDAWRIHYCIAWIGLSLAALATPPYHLYTSRHWIYFFMAMYGCFSVDAAFTLYVSVRYESMPVHWSVVYACVCFALFVLIGTLPQPMNPKNLNEAELKDGKGRRLSPEATASIFSWAVVQWVNSLVVHGFSHPLEPKDLYALTFQHLSRIAHADLSTLSSPTRRLVSRIYRANRGSIWVQILFSTFSVLFAYVNPYCQQKFLEYFEHKRTSSVEMAYLYVVLMLFVGLVRLLCNTIHLWIGRRWNVRTLCMLDGEIYAKVLRRKEARDQTGMITNLMSVDANRIADLPSYIYMYYNGPIEMIIAMTYLYHLLGTASLIGLGVLIVFFPATWYLSDRMRDAYGSLSTAEDRRNQLVNELLQGIRMIKYSAWESGWKKRVMEARRTELRKLRHTFALDVIMSAGYLTLPVLVSALAFIWYVKVDQQELSASVVFVSITLFDMLKYPIMLVPSAISTITETLISLRRIAAYLDDPEVEASNAISQSNILGFDDGSVFCWPVMAAEDATKPVSKGGRENDENSEIAPLLKRAGTASASSYLSARPFELRVPKSFSFPVGKLSLVIGPTGSGKTSLLHALLGEMDTCAGSAHRPMVVAYAAQEPFLRQASIRENILFGSPYSKERYRKVLFQCALLPDLGLLADGDRTEIGEKGISLSGGQKQRVALARAIYSSAHTVILDDCLSAVDSQTSRHLLDHCICGDLLLGRTVVMVTHHVQLCLDAAYFLVEMGADGQVARVGPVAELEKQGDLLQAPGYQEEYLSLLLSPSSSSSNASVQDKPAASEKEDDEDNNDLAGKKFMQDESAMQGAVNFKVHWIYLKACGGWFYWALLGMLFASSRTLVFVENWWLRNWAAAYGAEDGENGPVTKPSMVMDRVGQRFFGVRGEQVPVDYYIAVYALLCLVFVVCDTIRNGLLHYGSLRGSKTLFEQLLDRVIRAPIRFFDRTPVGRVLNRFGSDMLVVDMQMARTAGFMVDCVTGMIASSIVISAITPQFVLVACVAAFCYFAMGLLYLRSSRELKRINSISRSPIYSHFTETLGGTSTIRAFNQQRRFLSLMYEKLDDYVSPYYLLWMINRWLVVRMDTAGVLMGFFAAILLLANRDRIDAGLVGISLVYARSFLGHVYWVISQYTQLEMNLNAVERIQEYLELEQEPQGQTVPAAASWPSSAVLVVRNLEVRYTDTTAPVLHDVSFDVRDKEKVAVVGRTGSGKTTLGLCLLRCLEASRGTITLDGVDIARLDLTRLRSSLTLIPQDAALFGGTVRSNLDPFDEHSDGAIWHALQQVQMAPRAVQRLDQPVSDGGGQNWSHGQRQLLCMARALLRSTKLIVMDEATAGVDYDTDRAIQHTIHDALKDTTVLCIAHRLHTIIDYDRVLVLDQGRVVEFDSPAELLRRPDSRFRAMCKDSRELDALLERAKTKAIT
ncbi:P-loop containing nucleoside triphosphate hydrolase protein [Dichotomocladium elegans]|nr:P-loop containing nucleoside triphosphate hydrolase protein [Dichotomocladium elegans]